MTGPGNPNAELEALLQGIRTSLDHRPFHRLAEHLPRSANAAALMDFTLGLWLDSLAETPEYAPLHRRLLEQTPASNSGISWHPIVEEAGFGLGFIVLHRFVRIPLHDHPGTFGIQRVLAGRVKVTAYTAVSTDGDRSTLTQLGKSAQSTLGPGEAASYEPLHNNVHSVAALSPRALLLSGVFNRRVAGARNWYFPSDPLPSAPGGIFATKVRQTLLRNLKH